MERLILFAKRPRSGRVKTRLVPPLSDDQALELYTAFVDDQLRFARSLKTEHRIVELCSDGPWDPSDPPTSLPICEQGPGDLGERMHRAFARSHAAGAGRTVIVAADSPTLPASRVEQAFRCLAAGAPAVVSPAEDGGYVLIGLRRPVPELFTGVPWGGAQVLTATFGCADGAGVELVEIEGGYDVDDISGLRRLHRELGNDAARARAPATARCLWALDRAGTLRLDGAS